MNALVIAYAPLVHSTAARYASDEATLDYLRQIAECALEKAAHAYDPARGSFGRFARRELRRAVARAAAREAA